MFYQFVYKKGVKKGAVKSNQPIIIWLQGGPGCGSQFGLYGEIGPFVIANDTKIADDFVITQRIESWNNDAHLLFVDQPLGAGYSYTDQTEPISNTHISAQYLTDFLTQFFDTYTEFQQNQFYIFGESYAGHYIPAFAAQLLKDNQFAKYKGLYKGIGVGDGLTNAFQQVTYYSQYLYSAGLIDDELLNVGLQMQGQVQQKILNNQFAEAANLQDKIINQLTGNISQYNDPTQTSTEPWTLFLNKYKLDYMKVPNTVNNTGCVEAIYNAFSADIGESFATDVEFLLLNGKVLLYNGQLDFIVNTPGAIAWINNLKWTGLNLWKRQSKQFLMVNSATVGTYKQFDTLTFVTIYSAGHMVPADQPVVSRVMLYKFLNENPWK